MSSTCLIMDSSMDVPVASSMASFMAALMAACSTMFVAMTDHGRSCTWSRTAMHAVRDVSKMIGHGRVHDQSWPCSDLPWSVMHAVMDAVHFLSN